MADLRDKMERSRRFTGEDIERLAALERAYLQGLSQFWESLPTR
jgi:hypothetical protein